MPEHLQGGSTAGVGDLGEVVFQLSLDAVVVMNAQGMVVGWNPAAHALFGWSAAEATDRAVAELIVPEQYRASHDAGLKKFRETGQGPVLGQVLDFLTGMRRDGTEFPMEIRISHAGGQGEAARFVAFLRDISARKWAERNQHARYAVTRAIASRAAWPEIMELVMKSAGEQLDFDLAEVWLIDEPTGTMRFEASWARQRDLTGAFVSASMRTELAIGEGLLGGAVDARAASQGDLGNEPEARRTAAKSAGLRSALVAPIEGSDTALGVLALYRLGAGQPSDAVAVEVLAEIASQLGQHLERLRFEEALKSAQHRLQAELEDQALTDPLTGLLNRGAFDEAVTVAVSHGRRQADQFALLMLDLDNFKGVNDNLGHHTGDALLREVGTRLRRVVRATDQVARLGGDEFAILTGPGMSVDAARALAQKVTDAFVDPCTIGDREVVVGASVGVAVFPAHGMGGDELLRNADAAMYLAKRTRRGHAMFREGLPPGRGGSSPLSPDEHDEDPPAR